MEVGDGVFRFEPGMREVDEGALNTVDVTQAEQRDILYAVGPTPTLEVEHPVEDKKPETTPGADEGDEVETTPGADEGDGEE